MKFKIGDILQIVRVSDNAVNAPELYIDQIITIIDIKNDYKYNYRVKFNQDFKGDRDDVWWGEEELDYLCDSNQEEIIWNKLKQIADDISNLKETPDDRLRDIYYNIRNYNG